MECTHHIKQRMPQRGISKRMVELVLDYGTLEGQGKYVLRQKDVARIVADLRYLMKIIDKGGVTVVADGEVLITAYNCELHR
ncbi:TPA: hypothetical protein ACNP37_005424 [Raoultella ornithinolytica]